MKSLRTLTLLLFALFALAACDSGNVPLVSKPTQAAVWGPPTPFPPMKYPTEGPTPGLPPALTGSAPQSPPDSGNPVVASQYAPVRGKIQQQLLEIEKGASKVRGLNPLADVQEHFIDKDQLRENMLALRDKNYTREDARQSELQLWLLRLIKQPSVGLYQLQADMLSNEVVGYYDPEKKDLFVLNDTTDLDPLARETLAHEFVHSLQDQHYDLQKIIPRNSSNTDGTLAAKSVVEGDATLSGLLYADEYLTSAEFKQLLGASLSYAVPESKVPDIFVEELHFPYTYGLDFVKSLYARGGFDTVNKALADPPKSSEQIMHPEKYLAAGRDDPMPVGLPPLTATLGSGWTYRFSETMGEFELGVLLKDNGIKDPSAAIAGWGGGQADLYENGSNSVVLLGTVWDTRDDALEFEAAMRKSLALIGRSGSLWSDGTRFFGLACVRDKVVFAGGTEPVSVQKALDSVH